MRVMYNNGICIGVSAGLNRNPIPLLPRHVHLPLSTSSMSLDPESTENRLDVARQKKATGDAAFKAGNLTDGT